MAKIMKLEIECIRDRDLVAKVPCTCPHESAKLAALDIKHTLRLGGYDDDNFFKNVNANPRDGKCKCGRPYRFQWFDDGVDFVWVDAA